VTKTGKTVQEGSNVGKDPYKFSETKTPKTTVSLYIHEGHEKREKTKTGISWVV
jgi:hypothetical protein